MNVHVAQINIGTMLAATDDPLVAEFMDNLERINAIADTAPGFVWRLQTDSGNATEIQIFPNPLTLVNMSVWESADALKEYVYRSDHVEFFRRRAEWFQPDAKRVALVGHSRLGKTVLWAGATDSRFALIYSSQSGEMGAALSRRDFGESVDDMAANFGYQFAGNLQKFPGRWNEMPHEGHLLVSLSAPRPVFVSAADGDLWSDPRGQFLSLVAAGPVWRLLGKPDLGTAEMPPLDTPVATGTLAYLENKGPHIISKLDWQTFLDFADRHLPGAKPKP